MTPFNQDELPLAEQAWRDLAQPGARTRKPDPGAADTYVLPNLFFSAYEAVATGRSPIQS